MDGHAERKGVIGRLCHPTKEFTDAASGDAMILGVIEDVTATWNQRQKHLPTIKLMELLKQMISSGRILSQWLLGSCNSSKENEKLSENRPCEPQGFHHWT